MCKAHASRTVVIKYPILVSFSIENLPLSIMIGSLSSNSEATVTIQTALTAVTIAFSKKMAENQTEVNYLCKLYS
jgi:hypothetical protein